MHRMSRPRGRNLVVPAAVIAYWRVTSVFFSIFCRKGLAGIHQSYDTAAMHTLVVIAVVACWRVTSVLFSFPVAKLGWHKSIVCHGRGGHFGGHRGCRLLASHVCVVQFLFLLLLPGPAGIRQSYVTAAMNVCARLGCRFFFFLSEPRLCSEWGQRPGWHT